MSAKFKSKPVIIAAAAGVAALAFGGYVWGEECRTKVLEIYVFPMSGGYSIFLRTPEDYRILINGGPNGDIVRRLTKIIPFYSKRIDAVFASNMLDKSVAGLIEVIKRFEVSKAYLPGNTSSSIKDRAYETLLDQLDTSFISSEKLMSGSKIDFDSGIQARVLFPVSMDKFKYSSSSPPELLLNLIYGSTSFWIMGGATKKVQQYVASSTQFDSTDSEDTLVVSHAATADNLNSSFIKQISPEHLIYSKSLSAGKKVSEFFSTLQSLPKFNLKEGRVIKIISDGSHTTITPI